jgi:hypothetical protein
VGIETGQSVATTTATAAAAAGIKYPSVTQHYLLEAVQLRTLAADTGVAVHTFTLIL